MQQPSTPSLIFWQIYLTSNYVTNKRCLPQSLNLNLWSLSVMTNLDYIIQQEYWAHV